MREVWESLTYRWDRMNTPKEGGEREREKKKKEMGRVEELVKAGVDREEGVTRRVWCKGSLGKAVVRGCLGPCLKPTLSGFPHLGCLASYEVILVVT